MEKLINLGIGFVKGYTLEQIGWLLLALVLGAYIFYNRAKYTALFESAVIVSEESFNHGENRKKLEAAINFINYRTSKLPFIARFILKKFFSREAIINGIEKTLQRFSDAFANGRKIDIKGNEEDVEN